MATFISSFVIILLLILIMSIGIIFSNKILKGSCGSSCDCSETQKNKCPIRKVKTLWSIKN